MNNAPTPEKELAAEQGISKPRVSQEGADAHFAVAPLPEQDKEAGDKASQLLETLSQSSDAPKQSDFSVQSSGLSQREMEIRMREDIIDEDLHDLFDKRYIPLLFGTGLGAASVGLAATGSNMAIPSVVAAIKSGTIAGAGWGVAGISTGAAIFGAATAGYVAYKLGRVAWNKWKASQALYATPAGA
jgi:hypothetical protein